MFYTRRSARLQSPNKALSQKHESGPYGGYNTHMMNTRQHPNQDLEKKKFQSPRYFQPEKGNQMGETETRQDEKTNMPSEVAVTKNQPDIQKTEVEEEQEQVQKEEPVVIPEKEESKDVIVLDGSTNNNVSESSTSSNKMSATMKALNQIQSDDEKKKWKKGVKLPLSIRRQKMNQRLSRILTPKNALILLHEIKPGCVYKVEELTGSNPPLLVATVSHNNIILGTGQGMSKSQAKNHAAENAIKTIVQQTMYHNLPEKNDEDNSQEPMDEDPFEANAFNLPWAGLASFAMYKMFAEWQNQGTELPMGLPALKPKKKPAVKPAVVKKELPPNAEDYHPSVLLNMMRPGVVATELERDNGPKGRVTMGYLIDGQMFKGVAGNRKEARKEAAKAALTSLYGIQYK